MNKNLRKQLVVFLTFISGLYFFLEFVVPEFLLVDMFGDKFETYHEKISDGFILVGAMAIFLGVFNLVRFHGESILKTKRGWVNSFALILAIFVSFGIRSCEVVIQEQRAVVLTEVANWGKFVDVVREDFASKKKDNLKSGARIEALEKSVLEFEKKVQGEESIFSATRAKEEDSENLLTAIKNSKLNSRVLVASYKQFNHRNIIVFSDTLKKDLEAIRFEANSLSQKNLDNTPVKRASSLIYEALFVPLGSAMFSLLAFYVATAAYRSFRIRSVEAGIMMLAALLVVLGQIPHGPLYVYEGLPDIREWLMKYLNTPAFRAILFGSLIAGLSMAVRMWLSLEDSPLSAEEDG